MSQKKIRIYLTANTLAIKQRLSQSKKKPRPQETAGVT